MWNNFTVRDESACSDNMTVELGTIRRANITLDCISPDFDGGWCASDNTCLQYPVVDKVDGHRKCDFSSK